MATTKPKQTGEKTRKVPQRRCVGCGGTFDKKELLRSIKFTLFSASAGIIQVAAFAILNSALGLPYWPSYLAALILSVLWNFTFNRKFTFKSANNVPVAMLKVALFYAVFTPLSTWWTDVFVKDLQVNEYIVLAVTMVINFVTEFLYDKFVVFRNSIDTNNLAQKEQTPQE